MKTFFTSAGVVLLSGMAAPALGQTTQSSGATGPALLGRTTRLSVASTGAQGNAGSLRAVISANGRFVAFASDASNLVPGDTNGFADVFVRDRLSGTIERVSLDSAGAQGNSYSDNPAISADGRFVAFTSEASNLVLGDANGEDDVFLRDRLSGTTTLVSVDSAGAQGNDKSGYAYRTSISADGRSVAFYSLADNLVLGDTNLQPDTFVRDLVSGTTMRVSVDSAGVQSNSSSFDASISADGRCVAFSSRASNLVSGDTNGSKDVFVHDLLSGTTERVSLDSAGAQGNGDSYFPALSADGRSVAFTSTASNFVPGDTREDEDVFLRDRLNGTTTLVSVGVLGNPGIGPSAYPAITPDGRYVAFHSEAQNLVRGDRNFQYDVFVRDLLHGSTTLVSVASAGDQGNSTSAEPSISADGRAVAFVSYASTLVPGDTNATIDVFVHTSLLTVYR